MKKKYWIVFLLIVLNVSLSKAQIMKSIIQNDTVLFQKALQKADVSEINNIDKKNEMTPLTEAIKYNNTYFAKLLIEKGADVNLVVSHKSPLFYAVSNKNKEITEILLNHQANPDIANDFGATPLHVAAKNCDTAIVNLLIKYKVNVNAIDNAGFSPLAASIVETPISNYTKLCYDYIRDVYFKNIMKSDQVEIPDSLMSIFDSLNTKGLLYIKLSNVNGKNFFDIKSIYQMYAPVTYQLINAGAEVCLSDKKGKNVLAYIHGYNFFFHKLLLFTHSTNCDLTHNVSKVTLETSIKNNDPIFARLLLISPEKSVIQSLNADEVIKNCTDVISKTCSKVKYSEFDASTIKNPDYNPKLCQEYLIVLKELLVKGVQDTSGYIINWGCNTWVHPDVAFSQSTLYDLMILSAKSGCNPNISVRSKYYQTPLLLRLTHDYGDIHDAKLFDLITTLIDNGASLNPIYTSNDNHYKNCSSPLAHAIADKSEDLVRLYVSKGAKMDESIRYLFPHSSENIKKILIDAGYKQE